MEYYFLAIAAAWALQFALSFWQLRRFHKQLAELRKLGRCSVGMSLSRWRGRTYGVLVLNDEEQIVHAALLTGWTIFSRMRPVAALGGVSLGIMLGSDAPLGGLSPAQWQALRHAGQFFQAPSMRLEQPRPAALSH